MVVSKNRGTPKSSTLIGFSIINHPYISYWRWGYSSNRYVSSPEDGPITSGVGLGMFPPRTFNVRGTAAGEPGEHKRDKTGTQELREDVQPRNPTWIPTIATFKGSCLFPTIILGIHVSFREFSAIQILLILILRVFGLSPFSHQSNPFLCSALSGLSFYFGISVYIYITWVDMCRHIICAYILCMYMQFYLYAHILYINMQLCVLTYIKSPLYTIPILWIEHFHQTNPGRENWSVFGWPRSSVFFQVKTFHFVLPYLHPKKQQPGSLTPRVWANLGSQLRQGFWKTSVFLACWTWSVKMSWEPRLAFTESFWNASPKCQMFQALLCHINFVVNHLTTC